MNTNRLNGALSDTPSVLIKQAIEDLEKCENSPEYTIDMGVWHEPRDNEVCAVCLAGATIAMQFDISTDITIEPGMYKGLEAKMEALDEMRCGNVGTSLETLGINETTIDSALNDLSGEGFDTDKEYGYVDICGYYFEPERFKSNMLKIAKVLHNNGI